MTKAITAHMYLDDRGRAWIDDTNSGFASGPAMVNALAWGSVNAADSFVGTNPWREIPPQSHWETGP
ncbi:MAG: hypothetical protein ETSY2_50530 [Candidatus Entotheonella gemina]|uniref:Uncharacterized protein n=1 Tax=Candidatus Entotheonella gemina TaxID=1429439 RepID=W4L9C5_9BACT|nr:MAG: hypothetical protein ETSY2_50530 [Candidatus Entotheonella gemina]